MAFIDKFIAYFNAFIVTDKLVYSLNCSIKVCYFNNFSVYVFYFHD